MCASSSPPSGAEAQATGEATPDAEPPGHPDRRLLTVLSRRLERRDRPSDTHYTLEIAAYWQDDFLDAVRAGLRRRLTLGGLRSAGRANLAVELPPPLRPYTVARIHGREAQIIFPADAVIAVRRQDGRVDAAPPVDAERRAPFPVRAYTLRFHETLAFRVGTLTFVARFVHRDGRPRRPFDWLLPAFIPGYLG